MTAAIAAATCPALPGRRGFATFSIGIGASFAGAWAQRAAIGWLAWNMTRSVAGVGFFVLVDLLAASWVAPLSGAVTDRSRPYRLLLLTGGGSCVLALLLCLLSALELLSLPLLWGIALLDASLRGFGQPAQMLAPGMLCEPGRLPQAVATSAVTIALAIGIGPALAGLCMHYLDSVALVFALNALSFVLFSGALRALRPWLDRHPLLSGRGFWQDMGEGFRYAVSTARIRQVLLLALLFSLLARPFAELLPALVGDVFRAGPGLLAALMSAQGIGAVVGALLMLLRRQDAARLFDTLCLASLGIALALPALVASDGSAIMLPAIALAGLCHVICNICLQSLCQLHGQARFRGRVMALYGLLFRVVPTAAAFAIAQAAFLAPLDRLIGGLAIAYGLSMLGAWWCGRKRG